MTLPARERGSQATPTSLERRCASQQVDRAVIAQVQSRACWTCGCVYLDYPDGHDAHQVVFGHRPAAGDTEAYE